MSKDLETLKSVGGWLIIACVVIIPFAIGVAFGAGAGWLTFATVLVVGLFQTAKRIREEEKKLQAEAEKFVAEKQAVQAEKGERENE